MIVSFLILTLYFWKVLILSHWQGDKQIASLRVKECLGGPLDMVTNFDHIPSGWNDHYSGYNEEGYREKWTMASGSGDRHGSHSNQPSVHGERQHGGPGCALQNHHHNNKIPRHGSGHSKLANRNNPRDRPGVEVGVKRSCYKKPQSTSSGTGGRSKLMFRNEPFTSEKSQAIDWAVDHCYNPSGTCCNTRMHSLGHQDGHTNSLSHNRPDRKSTEQVNVRL
mmetsp:Transcript_4570/g.8223  ORF Transcript_4570/g.8223 Transcript_4570/m.8223 type:complete len:222 (-) Transcript_4570:223-888(-)